MGGIAFFTADDGLHGRELWKSDGTRAGTVLVKDIDPNADGDYPGPRDLLEVEGTLFFTADDGTHGRELWKSDGTAAGTVLVKDVHAGGDGGAISSLTNFDGRLLFFADDGAGGRGLWRSDGTGPGTTLIKNIHPEGRYPAEPLLTTVGGTLFVSASDGAQGTELWKSDGTEAGTVLVKDIWPGASGGAPSRLTGVGETLFFSATDGIHGEELWKSDGTESGTVMVYDWGEFYVDGHSYTSIPTELTEMGGTLFFALDGGSGWDELWRSDGTETGTVRLDPGLYGYDLGDFTVMGESLLFRGYDGRGDELWKTDGTSAGTVLVKNINPGYSSSSPYELTLLGNTLFFVADDGTRGRELWKSDGTRAGTVLVKDIVPDDEPYRDRGPSELAAVGRTLFFAADDDTHGAELWKSDGSRAGTVLVKDINLGGVITVPPRGRPDNSTGTMTVEVATEGAGQLAVTPHADSPVRGSVYEVSQTGTTTVTLRPTKAGMALLDKNGRVQVKAKFTFTPCGGTAISVIRRYILRFGAASSAPSVTSEPEASDTDAQPEATMRDNVTPAPSVRPERGEFTGRTE